MAKKTDKPASKKKAAATTTAEVTAVSTPQFLMAEDETKLVFGITINLKGTPIPVTTENLKDAQENGIEFELPQPLRLGSFDDFVAWFEEKFKVELPKADQLPPPLDDIIGKLTSLEVTVEAFYIKVPGSKSEDPAKRYKLVLSGTWPTEGIVLIPDLLSIDGVAFGATNIGAPAPTSS